MSEVNYQNDLSNIIDDQDEVQQVQQNEVWTIQDLSAAVWADEKIHEKEIKIQEVKAVADANIEALKAKIEKLERWKEEATKKDKDDITFFKEHLHLYHRNEIEHQKAENARLAQEGKKEKKIVKTIKLPYRDLTCKTQAPSILINGKEPAKAKDDEQLLEFVRANSPEHIKVSEEVKWSEFKSTLTTTTVGGKTIYVNANGEPIDFIELQGRGEAYGWTLKDQ